MTSLQNLVAYGNSFNGTLPANWNQLSALSVLDLHANSLTGSVPAAWANMTSLINVDISGNQMTGSLPSAISNWSNLVTLTVGNGNTFSGTIPGGYFSNLQALQTLDMRSLNGFTGNINLTAPTSLRSLYFHFSFLFP